MSVTEALKLTTILSKKHGKHTLFFIEKGLTLLLKKKAEFVRRTGWGIINS